MSELPEGELAGVGVDAPPQGHFPPGDVRRHPEAPGHSYLGQAAAEPTSGQHQVPSEDPLFDEFEIDDGEAPQLPAPNGSQAAPTVTTGGVVGVHLQQVTSLIATLHYLTKAKISKSPARKASALHSLQLKAVPPLSPRSSSSTPRWRT
jgi:hypothetical protein